MTSADIEALLRTPLGDLLARLLRPEEPSTTWIDIRDPASSPVPYRAALAAAQRGELAVHRVGRRRLVRRQDLDRWVASRPTVVDQPEPSTPTQSDAERILAREGWRKSR